MNYSTIEDDEMRYKGSGFGIGKIVKGTIHEAPIKLKVSSIPSKSENVIYRSRSQRAFGDSTKKDFHHSQLKSNRNPGPGVYNGYAQFQKISSKKGLGSFASSTVNSRLEKGRSHNPGPGQYQVFHKKSTSIKKSKQRSKTSILNTTSQSAAILSSKFQAQAQVQAHQLFKEEIQSSQKLPGPGFYEINNKKMGNSNSQRSFFKSKVQRFTSNKFETPPVGIYQVNIKKQPHPLICKLNPEDKKDLPESDLERKQKLQNIVSEIDLKRNKGKSNLGPGSYQNISNFGVSTRGFKIKENIYDRFGNMKDIYSMAKTINVSEIDQLSKLKNNQSKNSPQKGPTSMFKSNTQRADILLPGKIGPAKYKVENSLIGRKTHHINFTQKWV